MPPTQTEQRAAWALAQQHLPEALKVARDWGDRYDWLADDFESDVTLRLYEQALAADEPGRKPFAERVVSIALDACTKRVRTEYRRNRAAFDRTALSPDEDPLVGTASREQGPLGEILDREFHRRSAVLTGDDVVRYLEMVAPREAEALRLRLRGYSFSRIAAELGIVPWAARELFRRARSMARNHFNPEEALDDAA